MTARSLVARHVGAPVFVTGQETPRRRGLTLSSLPISGREGTPVGLLTLDERGFWAVAPLQGGAFTVLPADADG